MPLKPGDELPMIILRVFLSLALPFLVIFSQPRVFLNPV